MFTLISDLKARVDEMVYREFTGKEISIKDLFPDWDTRKDEVRGKGGIRLKKQERGLWTFSVHWGRYDSDPVGAPGDWYTVHVNFTNLPQLIAKHASDLKIQRKQVQLPDLRKMSLKIMNEVNMKVRCSDKSFVYWGYAYILTRANSIYGPGETRKPKRNNVRLKGVVCKHIGVVFGQFPLYVGTMANYLWKYYRKEIEDAALGRE